MTEARIHIHEVKRGVLVEWLSAGYMVVEAGVAIGAGLAAHSLLLVAFGADSIIELVSSAALLWRLSVEANGRPEKRVEKAEHIASWIVGIALLALAVYIVAQAVHSLIAHPNVQSSLPGLLIAVASSIFMPILSRAKKRIGRKIGSKALEADGSCSMVCAYMSWIVLVGVLATTVFGWWWIDIVAALGLAYYVVHEGLEAIGEARE